jgi:hypothetical protein
MINEKQENEWGMVESHARVENRRLIIDFAISIDEIDQERLELFFLHAMRSLRTWESIVIEMSPETVAAQLAEAQHGREQHRISQIVVLFGEQSSETP